MRAAWSDVALADGPALFGLEKAGALVALDARVAHDQSTEELHHAGRRGPP